MQVEADPNQLRYTASLFSNGANDLRQKAKRIEDIQNGLVQGQNSWKGEGAQGFSTTMEKIQNEIQQKAGILEEAAQILIRFAYQMDNVNQIRNQASNLERTLWSFSGDSEATFQERQSISFQVNQLLQEAEWQANAADAQATSALNSLSIPMPDLNLGNGAPKPTVNEPWYDHVIDWFKEQGHEFVVAYEKHWTTGNIWYDELNYWTLGIPDQVEKVFHTKPFSLENLEANLDLFISVVPVTKAESVALDVAQGGVKAVQDSLTAEAYNNEKVLGQTQGATSTEEADASKGTGEVGKKENEVDGIARRKTGVGKTGEGIPIEEVKPHVLDMIYRDDNGVYGYLPKVETPYAKYDFTDVETVMQNRVIREEYLEQSKNIQAEIDVMVQQGTPIDEIANTVVNMRNQDKISARAKMSPEELAPIEQRNMEMYGNAIGPDAKWLFNKTKKGLLRKGLTPTDDEIWDNVIQGSMRKDDVINTLLGIKH